MLRGLAPSVEKGTFRLSGSFGRIGTGLDGSSSNHSTVRTVRGSKMEQVIDVVETKEEVVELTLEQLEQVGGGCGNAVEL
jgi:hypothetical protein